MTAEITTDSAPRGVWWGLLNRKLGMRRKCSPPLALPQKRKLLDKRISQRESVWDGMSRTSKVTELPQNHHYGYQLGESRKG